ncbi:MAG: deoxyhypusine synthase family protein, partial [Euryarchaeota archaeon]|nr:deoxyhypusine synthase family protein [Euryarchaeota archaeon]
HYKGSSRARDEKLRDEGISRVFDVFLPEKDFLLLEKGFRRVLEDMEGDYTIRSLLAEVGRKVRDRRSILRAAADVGVPVFCPGLADSMLGLHAWLEAEKGRLRVDALRDMKEIVELCFGAGKSGAVFIGGGVPKNFILQAMLVSPNTFDYAIQITMDRPETGGLSGATLEEAISWGKVGKKARKATVYSDATIALPVIFAALLERTKK